MAGETPWLLDGTLVYALDEDLSVNRFSCQVQGGYTSYGGGRKTSREELEAIARLISSAPEMAEMLIGLRSVFQSYASSHEAKSMAMAITDEERRDRLAKAERNQIIADDIAALLSKITGEAS